MNVTVETEYVRFGADRAQAFEWLLDALIADGVVEYDRRGDLHRIRHSDRGSKPNRAETPSGSVHESPGGEANRQNPVSHNDKQGSG